MKIQKFTSKGVQGEDVLLPKEIEVKINLPLLAQAIYVYEERGHVGLRKTKTRAEINRTSKKVYKQKGTGGARHGSRRANVFVGGGVALGPRPVRRILTISNSIKNKAKLIAFTLKAKEKEMAFISGISKIAKTKEAGELLKALTKITKAKRFTFVLSDKANETGKNIRNLGNAKFVMYRNINAFDIYRGGMILLDEEIFEKKEVKKEEAKEEKQVKKVVKKGKENK